MCGIAGFISKQGLPEDSQTIISKMTDSLVHRGPDSDATQLLPGMKTALGHRRLAVIELNDTASQPMTSSCGQYSLVFNGEIYNYKELRERLSQEGKTFNGSGDTEVLLNALVTWGIDKTLACLNGMFAFAFTDMNKQEVFLARDRMGIKPLYYGLSGKNFIFASELKAIKAHSSFNNEINKEAISLFFRHHTIPAPWTIYERVFQLRAGCYLRFSIRHFEITRMDHYWEIRDFAEDAAKSSFKSPEQAQEELETLLTDSVKMRMQADVPYGAFLSGGIDSSLIVALMQKQSSQSINTFSIGFENPQYNESTYAAKVAKHLNTNHRELIVSSKDVMELIPSLPDIYDQPFADSSQLPTYLVSKMAREHVTVCLSGDGGDELFSGYDRYNWGLKVLGWNRKFSPRSRRAIAYWMQSLSPTTWNRIARIFSFLPAFKSMRFGEKIHKLANILTSKDRYSLYKLMSSQIHEPKDYIINGSEPMTVLTDQENWLKNNDYRKQMQFIDQMIYLPDDILHKVDRASMAVSLEVRVPLLDHRIVECSWKFPNEFNLKNKMGKQPLRQLLNKHVPKNLIERPKMGFAVPMHEWLRGPLKEWAADLLSTQRLDTQGLLNSAAITQLWEEHQSGKKNLQDKLWSILMLQAWMDKN